MPWFEHFVSVMNDECRAVKDNKKIRINYALQTNGILLDDTWAQFLNKNNFLTGISIDANEKIHDSIRPDAQGKGTYKTCLKSKALLEKHNVKYNVLCVLTNDLASVPDKVWRFITGEKIKYIQFIPCMESVNEKESSGYALKPHRFAGFYTRLFSFWVKALEQGDYYSVKLFDDTADFFLKGIPSSCGINGRCHLQYVAEADGSVYPCDFYAADRYNAGKLTEYTLKELFEKPVMQNFLNEERSLPEICASCSYLRRCGGGCKRMRKTMYFGDEEVICGYKIFLDKCLEPLGKSFSNFH